MPKVTDTLVLQAYDESLNQVRRYIREHIDEPLNRNVLAAIAGFSVSHFQRLCSDYMGESIARYVRRERMERAGRKLRMGAVDITEVALAAGFDSHAAFSRAFKQQFGISPSDFRQLSCSAATQILMKGKAI